MVASRLVGSCFETASTQACVGGMFEYKDFGAFKQHMRDFLVQTKQFADKDNADLFAEETEKQREVITDHDPVLSPKTNPSPNPNVQCQA